MAQQRTVLVVGCGAIGGLVAAGLSRVCRVLALDTNAEHVAAIRNHGLRITGLQQRLAQLEAATDAAAFAGIPIDAVIFLTKSKATAPALAGLLPFLSGTPLLVTVQNGMGNAEVLLDACDNPVARGVSMDAGRYVGPGIVEQLIRAQKSWIGPVRGSAAEMAWFADLLTAAGMPTELLDDPMGAVWAKFVFNAVMNPVGALMQGVNAARYESAEIRDLIDEMEAECVRVVEALGGHFAFDPLDYVKKVRSGAAPISKHAGSMASDLARGAATEIDELTGFVVREGERLGVAVPVCRTVWRLVKGLEVAAGSRLATPGVTNSAQP